MQQKYNTMKALDEAVQGIEADLAEIKTSIQALATPEDLSRLVESVQKAMERPAAYPSAAEAEPMSEPMGNYSEINPFDPTLNIEIYMVPQEGRYPKILEFPGVDGRALRYAPRFDEKQRAHYYMPRKFAEGQLKNESGMRFGLCWPTEISVSTRGERMRKELRHFTADPDCPPIMVTKDGVPIRGARAAAA